MKGCTRFSRKWGTICCGVYVVCSFVSLHLYHFDIFIVFQHFRCTWLISVIILIVSSPKMLFDGVFACLLCCNIIKSHYYEIDEHERRIFWCALHLA